MKLFLGLLTSHRLDKLKRLIQTVREQYRTPEIDLHPVIVVNTLDDNYYQEVLKAQLGYPVVRTESNGKPGKGKNSVAELFLGTDCDFMTQFDGDDLLYPTYLRSIWNHVKHFPSLDVLGIIPLDIVKTRSTGLGYEFPVGNFVGSVWGVSLVANEGRNPSPARGSWLDETLPRSNDYTILQSKKSAKIKIDEDIAVGEDHLYTMQLLSLHQKGELQYFQTMSSDMYIVDATVENSIQKQFPQHHHVQELKNKGIQYLNPHRSNFGELPLIYKELLMTPIQKQKWVQGIF